VKESISENKYEYVRKRKSIVREREKVSVCVRGRMCVFKNERENVCCCIQMKKIFSFLNLLRKDMNFFWLKWIKILQNEYAFSKLK